MPQTIVIETYQEFDLRHGGNCLHFGPLCLWPDGAQCSYENREQCQEPPTSDHHALLTLRQRYLREWVKRLEQDFYRCKQAGLDFPRPDLIEELRHKKDAVEQAREELQAIETELQTLHAASAAGRVQQLERERLLRLESLRATIATINL